MARRCCSGAARTAISAGSITGPRSSTPRPDSEIVTEEVFGPVLTVQRFRGEDEGVAIANNTRFGLAATLVTGDPARAARVSARLRAGTVWVNCFFVRDLGAPFGGNGQSGIGREGGTFSFDFYCDVKNTVFAPDGWTLKHGRDRRGGTARACADHRVARGHSARVESRRRDVAGARSATAAARGARRRSRSTRSWCSTRTGRPRSSG